MFTEFVSCVRDRGSRADPHVFVGVLRVFSVRSSRGPSSSSSSIRKHKLAPGERFITDRWSSASPRGSHITLSTWRRIGCFWLDRTEKAGPYWLKTRKWGGGRDQEIHPHVREIKQPIRRCFNVTCLCLKIKAGGFKSSNLHHSCCQNASRIVFKNYKYEESLHLPVKTVCVFNSLS